MSFGALLGRLNNPKYRYVVVTTLVSLLSFGRNLIFMKTLNLAELGQVAIMQTIIMLVGLAQLGLLNGAYIQYAAGNADLNRRIVAFMAGAIAAIGGAIFVLYLLARSTLPADGLVWHETLLLGLTAGFVTIASNSMNNALVADGLLGQSNAINIAAVLSSMLVAFLSRDLGLTLALASILLQPVVIAAGAVAVNPNLRPGFVTLDRATFVLLMKHGMAPFVGSIFVLGLYQIERWAIGFALGSEALGKFYIVIMYATFFAVVPAALLNVYLPQVRQAHAAGDAPRLRHAMTLHARDLIGYFLIAVVATVLFVPFVVDHFLPQFRDSIHLVYYSLPGFILFSLRDSAALLLYSIGKVRVLLISGIVTVFVFVVCLFGFWVATYFSLTAVVIARLVAIVPGTLMLFFVQYKQMKRLEDLYVLASTDRL